MNSLYSSQSSEYEITTKLLKGSEIDVSQKYKIKDSKSSLVISEDKENKEYMNIRWSPVVKYDH